MRPTSLSLAALAALALAAPAAALALAAPAAAQDSPREWLERCRRGWAGSDRVHHCEVRESRIPAGGVVRVDGGRNGGAIVRAWDGRDVVVRARVQAAAGTEREAAALARGIDVHTAGTIRATGPETRRNAHWSVTYEILVPARTDLEVQAVNGPVSVEGVTGRMTLETRNGPVNLTDVAGAVTARTTNGPLNIALAGRGWTGGGLDAETRNGPVNLRIAGGYAARLETGTVHGSMNVRLPVAITRTPRGARRVSTDLNGGGATVRAVTTHGPVNVRAR